MTAPHPFNRLVALAGLAALFFTLLALWLPAAISEIDLGSGGGGASIAPAHESSTAPATVRDAGNVFKQPVTSALWLFESR